MSVEQIKAELLTLSQKDLEQIKGRVNQLLNTTNGGGKNGDYRPKELLDRDVSYFKQILVMQAKKFVGVPSDFIIEKDKYKLDSNLNIIAKEIKVLIKSLDISKKDTTKFCRVIIEAAIAKIEESGKPKSFRMLIHIMGDPRSLLDESWPGYVGTSFWKQMVLR